MKVLGVIIFSVLFWNISYSQYKELPEDSLITKFKIKTVKRYSIGGSDNDTTKETWMDIWKFDTLGRCTFHKSKEMKKRDERKDGPSEKYFFYNGNNLVEYWDIGRWRIKSKKIDTAISKYFYDDKNRLITERFKNGGMLSDETFIHKYTDKYELVKCIDTKNSWIFSTDSLIYLENGEVGYSYNTPNDILVVYKYNKEGQLINEKVCNSTDSSKVIHINRYYYNNGLLYKETNINSNPFDTIKNDFFPESGLLYYYDKNKLITEIRRLSDNGIMFKYEYEFYRIQN
jgi:hypothetical protein